MLIPRAEFIWSFLALAVGLLAAIMSLHTDNLQYLVLFVFVQAAVFGCARPAHPLRWAALIAICVPLSLVFNYFVTLPDVHELGPVSRLFLGPLVVFFKTPHAVPPRDILGSCMAFLPAVAGSFAGAWLSRLDSARTA